MAPAQHLLPGIAGTVSTRSVNDPATTDRMAAAQPALRTGTEALVAAARGWLASLCRTTLAPADLTRLAARGGQGAADGRQRAGRPRPGHAAEFRHQRQPHGKLDIVDAGHWEDAAAEYAALETGP